MDKDQASLCDLFRKKVTDNYAMMVNQWLKLRPTELIEQADKIYAVKTVFDGLLCADTDQMEYLMRFANPLEVVTEQWRDDHDISLHPSLEDDVEHSIGEIMSKRDAEQYGYELDPVYTEKREEQSQTMC